MHRRYDRSHARFLQPDPYGGSYDPADPQSLNRYAYTRNDPVNFTDPSGLTLCSAQYSFSDCGGWEGVAGGYFGDAYATHQRHYGGLSAEVVGDMQAHEERVNNAYGGNGYRTNAEVNRAVADFYIYYRFNADGGLWTDFAISGGTVSATLPWHQRGILGPISDFSRGFANNITFLSLGHGWRSHLAEFFAGLAGLRGQADESAIPASSEI